MKKLDLDLTYSQAPQGLCLCLVCSVMRDRALLPPKGRVRPGTLAWDAVQRLADWAYGDLRNAMTLWSPR